MRGLRTGLVALGLLLAAGASLARSASPLDRIDHLIVIFQENWSFDGLYGMFPGANGIANAGATVKQTDREGRPYFSPAPTS
jgi:phospholipase C